MQVGSFEFQHLMDARSIDGVRGITNLLGSSIGSAKSSLDQFFTVLVEQVESWKVGAS